MSTWSVFEMKTVRKRQDSSCCLSPAGRGDVEGVDKGRKGGVLSGQEK